MQPDANSNVDVSVLVPVLNEGRDIVEVVRAMSAQRLDGTLELIFADGRSTDDTKEQLERLALTDDRIRVLENPRRGVASGLNVCLAAARGKYVARMDGHALYPPNYLQQGVDRLRADILAHDQEMLIESHERFPCSGCGAVGRVKPFIRIGSQGRRTIRHERLTLNQRLPRDRSRSKAGDIAEGTAGGKPEGIFRLTKYFTL